MVGRAGDLGRAIEALRPGSGFRGVVLVGEPGSGKTTLARAIAETLRSEGLTTRFVLGTDTGQAVPLGAFHRTLSIEDPHEPAVMLAAAHRALAREHNLVLVIDDAHLLDPLSAVLVQQVASSDTARLIVTIRSGVVVPDAVTALWKEQLLLRVDLDAFDRTQTQELVAAVLDGEIDSSVVDRLHDLAGGSPLVLRGLIGAAREDGVLLRQGGRWRLHGRLRVGADVFELVQRQLAGLSAGEVEVVEIVSAAGVLDWNILRALCDAAAIARTEHRGVIQFVDDGSHTLVRPGHPIVGEVVRQRCGVARTRQLNTVLAQSLSDFLRRDATQPDPVGADVRTRIQLARFMMVSDTAPDLELITAAAAGAVTMSNLVLAEQLARFAFDRGGGLPSAIVLADAISWQGRGQEAEAILAAFDPDGADALVTVRWGCLRGANLFFGCGYAAWARAVLATVRERVASEELLSFVTAMEVSLAFFSGDVPAAIRLGRAALASEMVPTAMVWAAMATAGALSLSGRFDEVRPIARQGLQAARYCESGPQRYTIGLAEVLAYTASGDLDAADHVCERYSVMTGGVPQAEAIVNALVGRVNLARGRLLTACEALQKSLWTMSESLPSGWVMLVAAWLAQAEAARGNADGAAAALAKAEEADGPQVAVFVPELELARSWHRACVGQTTTARDHALRAAQTARMKGMSAVEMCALHTAVRFGDRSQSARLRQCAAQLASPLAEAIAAHSSGLSDHDGDRLDAAADMFDRLGAAAMAADASAHAAREHARVGARVKELEATTRAHWLAGCNWLRTPAVTATEAPLPITDREREIAVLVSESLTNREIAERLGVSVRTIDGHLYRIFAKLSIEDREQLGRLVRIRPAT
ncbi:helix-turn-helix transcriptional regulator [Mycolicibacterium austroafricanum]|uniref:helix-turn-helix transcriptional regulator n=1 Tax=Mycolicibacterium austroafricanum TaxID=39687 RepID=UPI001F24B50F|nr:LuxR family transcriptional regulator [Mycolicibacterium austroafricanum]